jgi:hypothetical protein
MMRCQRSSPRKKRSQRLQVERLEARELLNGTLDPGPPLMDLGTGTYQGYEGGLYPNGTDTPPAATESYAQNLAQQIVPLNASGNPDPVNGKIVMLSIGMSNTGVEFRTLQTLANPDPTKNPKLLLVNGAQGGMDVDSWTDPHATAWTYADNDLSHAGVTPAQVEVVWLKQAEQRPWADGQFPRHAQHFQSDMEAVARNLLIRYPNVKIAYLSTRSHAYTTSQRSPNPEPFAYETGFGVKWMIQDQINGVGNLNYDPSKGPVVAPLLLWGPYIWGHTAPRSDGFTWLLSDVNPVDLTHPSNTGRVKIADQLLAYFKTDPSATPWFLAPTAPGQGPVVTDSASATSGPPGLVVQFSASATDPSGGTITQYAWTYDDGGSSLSQNPTKTFDVPGTYNVYLTVSDSLGYTSQSVITITITASHSSALGASPAAGSTSLAAPTITISPPVAGLLTQPANRGSTLSLPPDAANLAHPNLPLTPFPSEAVTAFFASAQARQDSSYVIPARVTDGKSLESLVNALSKELA